MNALDSTRPTDSAIDSSMPSLSTPNCDEIDVANTLRQRSASNAARSEGALRDALERDDWQVLPTFEVAHVGLDHRTGPSSKEGVWPRARGSVGVDGNLGERPHHGRGSKRGRRQPESHKTRVARGFLSGASL